MRYVFLFFIFLFGGCATHIPSMEERTHSAYEIIKNKNITQHTFQTKFFPLFSYQKVGKECSSLRVYIEGDGLAWISKSRISDNPTPIEPLALKLMQNDESKCRVYIARPCQYVSGDMCEERYWTSDRFNDKIIQSFEEALDTLKSEYKNERFELVGYSGGGAVALLVASRRDDIDEIVTIAGNVDTKRWTDIHNIESLKGSLNPADFGDTLQTIKQYHLLGRKDKVVPKEVFFSYLDRIKEKTNISYEIFEASHTFGWEEEYNKFLKKEKRWQKKK